MPSRLTQEEFIKRAREIHGNKYDYSKVEYRTMSEKVCIICPEHGEFWQCPDCHIRYRGCPKCGRKQATNKIRIHTYEECYEIAKKCSCPSDMVKLSGRAYDIARMNGWLKDYTWFERKRHSSYEYDEVFEIAKLYECASDFQNDNNSAYNCARRNGWLKDYTWFLRKQHEPFSYEECFNIAKYYKKLSDFAKSEPGPYRAARKKRWINDYIWLERKKTKGYWTYEHCIEESKKYKTKREFEKKSGGAYRVSLKNNWIMDFVWLIDNRIIFNKSNIDCVYAYEFFDFNSVYIGRTLMTRQKMRDKEHIYVDKDVVHLFAKEKGVEIPNMKILEDNLTLKEGVEKEGYYVEEYRKNGWNVLNRAKTGSLGSLSFGKWNKETCYVEAKKYKSMTEFYKSNASAYRTAKRNGWLDDYTFLKPLRKPKGYWNDYNVCHISAAECKTRSEFAKRFDGAYRVSRKNGWLDDFFPK